MDAEREKNDEEENQSTKNCGLLAIFNATQLLQQINKQSYHTFTSTSIQIVTNCRGRCKKNKIKGRITMKMKYMVLVHFNSKTQDYKRGSVWNRGIDPSSSSSPWLCAAAFSYLNATMCNRVYPFIMFPQQFVFVGRHECV